jgi:hypothetical protein
VVQWLKERSERQNRLEAASKYASGKLVAPETRPFVWLSDVDGADFSRLSMSPRDAAPALRLREIRNLRVSGSRGLSDTFIDHVTEGRIP